MEEIRRSLVCYKCRYWLQDVLSDTVLEIVCPKCRAKYRIQIKGGNVNYELMKTAQ